MSRLILDLRTGQGPRRARVTDLRTGKAHRKAGKATARAIQGAAKRTLYR